MDDETVRDLTEGLVGSVRSNSDKVAAAVLTAAIVMKSANNLYSGGDAPKHVMNLWASLINDVEMR